MGLETPKRPEVKVKVPKFTKIDLGSKRPDTVKQAEAKRKNAEKVKKEVDEIMEGLEEGEAALELDEALKKLPSGKKVEKKKAAKVAEKPKKRGGA